MLLLFSIQRNGPDGQVVSAANWQAWGLWFDSSQNPNFFQSLLRYFEFNFFELKQFFKQIQFKKFPGYLFLLKLKTFRFFEYCQQMTCE